MFEIFVVICLTGGPTQCKEYRETVAVQATVSACEVHSRVDAALWASQNPGIGFLESCRQSKP